MTIISHLEGFLGRMDGGFRDSSSDFGFSIAIFKNQPFQKTITYSTVGLSDLVLSMGSQSRIRQEILCAAYESFSREHVASFLSTFADSVAKANKALLRGEVIGPSAPIVFGTLMTAVYCAVPMVYPSDLAIFHESLPATAFVWVIPIHESEADFVRRNGWEAFELKLEERNPDLWNLQRDSIA